MGSYSNSGVRRRSENMSNWVSEWLKSVISCAWHFNTAALKVCPPHIKKERNTVVVFYDDDAVSTNNRLTLHEEDCGINRDHYRNYVKRHKLRPFPHLGRSPKHDSGIWSAALYNQLTNADDRRVRRLLRQPYNASQPVDTIKIAAVSEWRSLDSKRDKKFTVCNGSWMAGGEKNKNHPTFVLRRRN